MRLQDEVREARRAWSSLTVYGRFEYCVILILTVLIAIVVASATWHLAINIGLLVFTGAFDPANQVVIQGIFGMISWSSNTRCLWYWRARRASFGYEQCSSSQCWPWFGSLSSLMLTRLQPTNFSGSRRPFWPSASSSGWSANKSGAVNETGALKVSWMTWDTSIIEGFESTFSR